MTSGKPDFTSPHNALARLAEGYQRYQSDISDSQIRDDLIQRYEFIQFFKCQLSSRAVTQ
jgi:hypothetical protein